MISEGEKEQRVKILLTYVEQGFRISRAVEMSGISRTTWDKWASSGDYDERIAQARSKFIQKNISIIDEAAKKDWRAAAWRLEKESPEDYGKQSLGYVKAQVTGQGQTNKIEIVFGDDTNPEKK